MWKIESDIPLGYSITCLPNFVYQIILNRNDFDTGFKDVLESERFEEVFQPEKFLTLNQDQAIITIDAKKIYKEESDCLNYWFSLLQFFLEDLKKSGKKSKYLQSINICFAGTSFAVSFAPWTWQYFRDPAFTKDLGDEIKKQMESFHEVRFGKKISVTFDLGFTPMFYVNFLHGGLWMDGQYNNIHSHNCDHYYDQARFFIISMIINEKLEKMRPVL